MTKKFDDKSDDGDRNVSTEDSDDLPWQGEGIGRKEDNETPGHPDIVSEEEEDPNPEDIKTQFSPSLPEDLIKLSHIFGDIKYKNKTTRRPAFSEFVSNAMKNHILIYFLLHPRKYDELHVDIKLERVEISQNIEGYMIERRAGVAEALLNLPDGIKKQGSHPADVLNPEKDNQNTKVREFISSSYSNQSNTNDDRRAIGATVSKKLSDTYKDVVRIAHNGKFRGNFSRFAERGLKYNIILTWLRDTNIRGKIQTSDDIDNPDEIFEKISSYAELVSQDLADAHRVMPEEIEDRVSTPSPGDQIFNVNNEHHQGHQSGNDELLDEFRESIQADERITTDSSTEESVEEVLDSKLREVVSSGGESDEELIPEHLVTDQEKRRMKNSREKRKSGQKGEDNRFTKKWGRDASMTRSGHELEPIIKRLHVFGYLLKHIEETGQDVGELSQDEFDFAEDIIDEEISSYFDRSELETAFEKIYENKTDFFELLEETHKISSE